jgi:hypothetical protein
MPRCADPHDAQPSSLGRLPLASIRGDEWDAEIRGSLELESGGNVQRIESPEPLPAGQLLCTTEDCPSRVHELPVRPITLEAPQDCREIRLGQVAGLAASAESGQGFDRQNGGREEAMTAQKNAGLPCASLFHIALQQDARVEVRPGAGH